MTGAMRIEHIGDATLILADCMDIMRDMPDKAFDLAIVDPPYGDGGGAVGEQETVEVRRMVRQVQSRRVNHAFGGRFERYAPPESIPDGRNMVKEISDRRGLP